MEAHPFLSNLGISPILQARSPTPATFPSALNSNNASVWATAVAETPSVKIPLEDWARCLKRYVDICEEQNLFPFQNINQSRNDQISDFLSEARQSIVSYLDKSKLFDEVKITAATRVVHVTHTGFHIVVFAKSTINDPSFEQWLQKVPYPHFNNVRTADGHWIKNLRPGVKMFVVNGDPESRGGHMPQRWHIGYEIECSLFPEIPGNATPSKSELEKFILEILFMPVLRQRRPKKILRRLI